MFGPLIFLTQILNVNVLQTITVTGTKYNNKHMSAHPHPDEPLGLCAGLCQPVTVTLAAAEWVSYRQPKRVWLTAVTVVSFHVYLKQQTHKGEVSFCKVLMNIILTNSFPVGSSGGEKTSCHNIMNT